MSLSGQPRLELHELCSRLVDGTLSEPQRRRLEEILAVSPEARRVYVRAMALSASLFDYASEMQTEAPERSPRPIPFSAAPPWWWAVGALGAAAAIALAFWLGGLSESGRRLESQPHEVVAHLSGAKDCQWAEATLQPGAPLQSGQRVELAAGFAEISFDSGALLVLEGPASLDVNSAWEAVLRRGALTASVPQEAIGFRISNAAVDVVDLGTEFSMVAEENGATEVFVLRGAIEAYPRAVSSDPARPSVVLRETQARRFDRNRVAEVRNREQKLLRFVRKVSLDRALQPPAFVHWPFDETEGAQAAAEAIGFGIRAVAAGKATPALLPLPAKNVRGEDRGERKAKKDPLLPSQAREGETDDSANGFAARLAGSNSSNLNAARVPGQRGRALNFDGQLAATALLPPFVHGTPRTVAFWIKIPPDAGVAESEPILAWPLTSDGDTMEFSWNRAPNQGAFGALRTSVGRGFIIGTTPLRDGQWHHVAVVFSHTLRGPQKMQARQYVDGRLDHVSAKHFTKSKVKRLGGEPRLISNGGEKLSMGRRPNEQGKTGFLGTIDELFLLDRALSQKEIRMLMLHNRLPSPEPSVSTLGAAAKALSPPTPATL
jgi:ferric-dicitrate binding protein FerR (iron transport regulator)